MDQFLILGYINARFYTSVCFYIKIFKAAISTIINVILSVLHVNF